MDYNLERLSPDAVYWLCDTIEERNVRDDFVIKLRGFLSQSSEDSASLDQVFSTASELSAYGIIDQISLVDLESAIVGGNSKRALNFVKGVGDFVRRELLYSLRVNEVIEDSLLDHSSAQQSMQSNDTKYEFELIPLRHVKNVFRIVTANENKSRQFSGDSLLPSILQLRHTSKDSINQMLPELLPQVFVSQSKLDVVRYDGFLGENLGQLRTMHTPTFKTTRLPS